VAFEVLFVCTGNICRSPMAERLLTARLRDVLPAGLDVVASSAGTGAVVGHGMDTPSLIALRELGGDSSGHVARMLTGALAEDADLVLTAESGHREQVLQAVPLAFRRTFTLREFARLGAGLGSLPEPSEAALRQRVAEVAARRGWADAPEPGADEIGDPFGATLAVARSCAAAIAAAIDGTIAALGLGRLAAPPDAERP
jgi:protein-tyrosine phosphatase